MSKARAHTNIALIKYWGKRDLGLNLPSVGSLSLTLNEFFTDTEIKADDADHFLLDGKERSKDEAARVFDFIDVFCQAHQIKRPPLAVSSENHVPTASGLASSASAFCALTLALNDLFKTELSNDELSEWSRRGSGSAARSVYEGFVVMDRGQSEDGKDAVARPIESPLDLSMVVIQTTLAEKKVSSTKGMERTRLTSPYFDAWVNTHQADLDAAEDAATRGDLERLGALMEHSTSKMHASALAAFGPLWYFSGTTWNVVDRVRALRDQGLPCWFTMDAGPHVKVLCRSDDAPKVAAAFENFEGVAKVRTSTKGPAARVLS